MRPEVITEKYVSKQVGIVNIKFSKKTKKYSLQKYLNNKYSFKLSSTDGTISVTLAPSMQAAMNKGKSLKLQHFLK
jgi:hypothetical protein